MNRTLSRAIGDGLELVADNWLLFGLVGAAGFFLGPSLLVYLERKDRLPRGLVWLYSVFFVPVAVLFMSLIASPQDYCNDPLPHEAFRPFYALFYRSFLSTSTMHGPTVSITRSSRASSSPV